MGEWTFSKKKRRGNILLCTTLAHFIKFFQGLMSKNKQYNVESIVKHVKTVVNIQVLRSFLGAAADSMIASQSWTSILYSAF